jgi:hypothetical protein
MVLEVPDFNAPESSTSDHLNHSIMGDDPHGDWPDHEEVPMVLIQHPFGMREEGVAFPTAHTTAVGQGVSRRLLGVHDVPCTAELPPLTVGVVGPHRAGTPSVEPGLEEGVPHFAGDQQITLPRPDEVPSSFGDGGGDRFAGPACGGVARGAEVVPRVHIAYIFRPDSFPGIDQTPVHPASYFYYAGQGSSEPPYMCFLNQSSAHGVKP